MRNFKQVDEKYSFTLDNKQIAFLATGALALFLLFFILGVLYGKGLGGAATPAATGPQAAQGSGGEAPSAGAVPAEQATEEAPAKPASAGEKVFRLEEESIASAEPAPQPVSPAKPAAPKNTGKPVAQAPKAPEPPVKDSAPAAPPRAGSRLKGTRLAGMKGGYTIQVASFTDPGDAKDLARKLESQGYPSYTTKASVRGKLYYRVRIGRFATNSEAQAQAAAFKQAEKTDAIAMRID